MNILISGGTGFIGKKLRNNATRKGHNIRLITREDIDNKELLIEKTEWATVIINLAGAPIDKRWTEKYKKEIYFSRINTTKEIVDAIKESKRKPKLLISVSAVGIYNSNKIHTEDDFEFSNDYLAQVCADWEKVALRCAEDTRVVIFRLGIVLGKHGGIMKSLTPFFKAGLGATMGSGEQIMSWVHVDDVVNAFFYAIKNQTLTGIFNLVSPNPISNRDFTKHFAKAVHRWAIFKIPPFIIKMLKGEQASLLLEEKYAIPKRLLEANFNFRNETVQTAFKQIFRKKVKKNVSEKIEQNLENEKQISTETDSLSNSNYSLNNNPNS